MMQLLMKDVMLQKHLRFIRKKAKNLNPGERDGINLKLFNACSTVLRNVKL